MNTPIDPDGRWPVALNVVMHVRSRCGLAEDWRFRLDPDESDSAVRVGTWAPDERDVAWESIDWHGLPGRTLFHVCMGVLSVRLFGAAEPVPRIVGVPLWKEVRAALMPEIASVPPLVYELQVCDDSKATLRVRQRAGERAICRTVALHRVDADPLLALLRLGLCHVKPDAVQAARHTALPVYERSERDASSGAVRAGH